MSDGQQTRLMPWRNRVTPGGEIIAVPQRGTLTGNRGVLIDAERRLVRDSQVRRWIACVLEFRGRQRTVMTPGRWTELFFLDEATALTAGHRPCAECRNAEYKEFQRVWREVTGVAASAAEIDRVLHAERRVGPWRKRTYQAESASLPDGTFIAGDERAWLIQGAMTLEWTPGGYAVGRPRKLGRVDVLTPPSVVAVLRAGYAAGVHPTARRL